MKITGLEVSRVFVPAPSPPFVWRRGLPGSPGDGYAAVLVVRTDEGCDGVALAPRLASGAALPDIVDRVVRDAVVGEDPLQRELLWHKCTWAKYWLMPATSGTKSPSGSSP
ncbi:MAG TPA: hypothetical protein VEJ84_06760 [Acidimicrobiales bacterium]|nr:hypothetical protein [Acidimicrobiales bacterium]